MDVIDNANMQRILDFLKPDDDAASTFKARKYSDHWVLGVVDYTGTLKFQATGSTFSEAVKGLAHFIYIFNRDAGVDNERSSSEG